MGWAKDFSSNFVLKIPGILYVFQDFYKRKLEKKIRPERKKEFLEVPTKVFAFFCAVCYYMDNPVIRQNKIKGETYEIKIRTLGRG